MKKLSRILSLLIVAIMLISPWQCVALAEESNVNVIVDNVYGSPEGTVDVNVLIENNPGILCAVFTVTYSDELKLLSASSGDAFSALTMAKPGVFTSPCQFAWDGVNLKAEDIKDGVVLTLTFEISKDAIPGTNLDINVSCKNVRDNDGVPVAINAIGGKLEVIDYTPGDVNSDKFINATDLVMIRRYITGGYEQTINELAADVDDNGTIEPWDLTLIRRYIAGGYGVKLLPSHGLHEHTMEAYAKKEATCKEEGNIAYWYCTGCEKYFKDNAGVVEITLADTVIETEDHNGITVDAVPPSTTSGGYTAGVWCDKCETWIEGHEYIEPIAPDEVFITYKYDTIPGDAYLPTAVAKAVTDGKIVTQESKNVTDAAYTDLPFVDNGVIEGYEFQGWYNSTASDAQKITAIAQGQNENVTLYAKWIKTQYTVILKAPLKSVPSITRTIDQTTLLPADKDMVVPNYYFMGWSDGSGCIIDQIEPGIGNVTVYANWTSATRNIAYAADYTSQEPIIMEDNGKYLFVYNVGYIDRVPVEIIEGSIYNSGTYKYIVEAFESATIGESKEKEINSTVANATTHSSSWTLSKEWNELVTEVNGTEQAVEQGKVVAVSDGSSMAYSSSASTYSGNSFHASNDSFVSSKTITDDSWKNSLNAEVSAGYGPIKASVGMSGEQAHSETQEDYSESKAHLDVSAEWNKSSSYTASGESFMSTTQTQSVLEQAKNTWNLEISKALTDTQARTDEESSSTTATEGYKSIVAFHNETTKGNSTTIERTFTDVGYYRYAMFAKVHVFAAVGYDMETGAYYVNTYSVVDDNIIYDFDYSSDGSYKDYDNAVLPFEIPVDVYNYIFEKNSKTEGLGIGRDGIVKEYIGDATNVRIPDYACFDNGDETYTVVPVTAVAEGLFANKTNIKSVRMSKFITSIPNNAFNGCTSLEKVEYNTDALVSIGDYAFDGCTSLNAFEVGNSTECKVTNIGTDAFKNVPNVVIYAENADVAEKAVSCGAKNVAIYMKHLSDLEIAKLSGKTLKSAETTTESFALYGADKTYTNLSVESNADTTIINGMSFADNTKTPLVIKSANVELNRVNIDNATGLAIQFTADNTNVTVKSVNNISTNGDVAILSKGINMSRGTGEYPELNVTGGDIVVCGEIADLENFAYLTITDGVIRSIDATEYENMLNSHYVHFDANGGNVDTDKKLVMWNSAIGELPTPTRDYYTFDGWWTAAEGGEEVTADTVFTETQDITLYAHWVLNEIQEGLASDMPEDAQLVDEWWTYTLTTSEWSEYGSWSGWSNSSVSSSDSRQVETRTIAATYKTQYNYSCYSQNSDGSGRRGPWKREWPSGGTYCGYYQERGWSDTPLYVFDTQRAQNPSTGQYEYFDCYGSNSDAWYSQTTRQVVDTPAYTQYRYRDRYLITNIEDNVPSDTEVFDGGSISNVKHYVQYRAK